MGAVSSLTEKPLSDKMRSEESIWDPEVKQIRTGLDRRGRK